VRRLLAVLVLLAVAGCGTGSGGTGSGGTTGPSLPAGSPSPDPTQPGALPPYARPTPLPSSEARAPGTTPRSVPWTFESLAQRGRRVFISFVTGGCMSPGYVAVAESARTVELAVWSQVSTGNRPCPAFARVTYGYVELTAPLGHRQLEHAPVTNRN
jgi:hypothetical protein